MTCQREKELLEQIEQAGEMYKVSALQLIKAGKRIAELEALNSALCWDSAGFVQERDALAARAEVMREALEGAVEYTALLDDFTQAAMREVLAHPDISADILRARDAKANAELLYALAAGQDAFDGGTGLLPFELRKIAEELEQAK